MKSEWGMGNGEWGMGNGQWGIGNGEWGMGNGQWALPRNIDFLGRLAKSEAFYGSIITTTNNL
ncbi:hypothetical protein [Moorena sp. SIO4G3]|uniref:hypothetical protein n=1 Tax=Moorena sp. SIO4G3 TaxID=2607821 RepID=UPI001429CC28|nr:hypothetical protein [Moorena sp. SIO4G3]NEO79161.1 hypothetical protein [Moorena sp. SIO4G3]